MVFPWSPAEIEKESVAERFLHLPEKKEEDQSFLHSLEMKERRRRRPKQYFPYSVVVAGQFYYSEEFTGDRSC